MELKRALSLVLGLWLLMALPLPGGCRAMAGGLPPASSSLEAEPGAPLDEDETQEVSQEELAQEDAQAEQVAQDPNLDLRQKLDRILKSYATMGASIAVIENGEITFTHVYGLRQRKGEKVTQNTAFQVGSISKMVAGIGLMALVEEGRVGLDEDLGEVLGIPLRNPQYPGTPITLRQVMTHTAGLRDSGYYRDALYGKARPLSELFSGDKLQYAFLKDFRPGTDQRYSNFGGGLAGALIENLTGQTVDDYIKEHVFAPLGITAGFQASLLPESLPLADMYAMPGKRLTKALREDPTHVLVPKPEEDYYFTAGKLIISAPDLAKLLITLCDGGVYRDTRILKESTVAEICTPQNSRGSVACDSGRGLYLNIIVNDQVEGRTMLGHGGKANGMLCAAYFDPMDRTGVVMLTNGCNNRKVYNDVGMLGRAVMRICYGELLNGNHVTEDPFLVD